MRLIAESGSTKAEWSLVEGSHVMEHAFTEGINPFFQTRREISRVIRLQLPEQFFTRKLDEIFFYGAGCTSEEKKNTVKASLISQFRVPTLVYSDLLAAGRSLFGSEKGIACILGTGSNTGMYDGNEIIKNVKSLGYVLGDEGSSSVLGKMFLSDCLKNLAPQELTKQFHETFEQSVDEVLDMIYNQPFPNRSLSKFSFFLLDHTDNEYVYDLISKNFRRFFRRNILQYDYQKFPVGFIGTMAESYKTILHDVANEFEVTIAKITESPMKGLIDYYYPKLI
jgi:N-acetylglucosamine kinase-like BadF-type ATPase